jgi:L-serine deaminase
MEPSLQDVFEKAAQLQELVPGAVLVGGSAAALHAQHRESHDHDHVVSDLAERFDSILENLESLGDLAERMAR